MAETPDRGLFALVSYVPDPLASVLYELRKVLPGPYDPEPHITLLPPRPLQSTLESACQVISDVLSSQPPFEVTLSDVDHFTATNTVYLRIQNGFAELNSLHSALNQGELRHEEPFDFRPHLTLGGPIDPDSMTHTLLALSNAWRVADAEPRFVLDQVICLYQEGIQPWRRFRSTQLKARAQANRTYSADPG